VIVEVSEMTRRGHISLPNVWGSTATRGMVLLYVLEHRSTS